MAILGTSRPAMRSPTPCSQPGGQPGGQLGVQRGGRLTVGFSRAMRLSYPIAAQCLLLSQVRLRAMGACQPLLPLKMASSGHLTRLPAG